MAKKKNTSKRVSKAAPKEAQASMSMLNELGDTGLKRYSGLVDEEWLYLLKGTRGLKTYREMAENDPVVAAVLYAVEMLLRPIEWSVVATSDAPEDEEAVKFLDSLLTDMSHSMSDFISEWMACPIYGYAPFEIVLKLRRGDNRDPGLSSQYEDGRLGIRKLAIRHPTTLHRWVFDESGGLQGMVQRTLPRWEEVAIPIDKMLLFKTMSRRGNPEGQSLLRRSFVPWYRKKKLEDIEAIGIERNMAGFPLVYYPAEWLSDSNYSSQLDEVKKVVQRIKVDEQAGLALPSILDTGGQKLLEFQLVSTSGKQGTDISPIIERYDRRVAMTMLADVILLGHEKVGSFALASSKTNLFTVGLGALLDDIGAVMSRHLIPRLLRLNGMKVNTLPVFKHSDIETVDLSAVGDYITKLASAGVPLFPSEGGQLERHLYRVAGLPEPDGEFPPSQRPPMFGGDPQGPQPRPQGDNDDAEPDDDGEERPTTKILPVVNVQMPDQPRTRSIKVKRGKDGAIESYEVDSG